MGIANAQRGLEVIRTIMEFISQPEYQEVVAMFGLVRSNSIITYDCVWGMFILTLFFGGWY